MKLLYNLQTWYYTLRAKRALLNCTHYYSRLQETYLEELYSNKSQNELQATMNIINIEIKHAAKHLAAFEYPAKIHKLLQNNPSMESINKKFDDIFADTPKKDNTFLPTLQAGIIVPVPKAKQPYKKKKYYYKKKKKSSTQQQGDKI